MSLCSSGTLGTDLVDNWFVDVCDVDNAVLVAQKSALNAQDVETMDLNVSTKKLER